MGTEGGDYYAEWQYATTHKQNVKAIRIYAIQITSLPIPRLLHMRRRQRVASRTLLVPDVYGRSSSVLTTDSDKMQT